MMGARALLAATIVAIGAAGALAFVTIHPPPLKVKARAARGMATAPPIALPEPEPAPPPTARDFALPSTEPATSSTAAPATAAATGPASIPIETLRIQAAANDTAAMEELGRRLIQGIGVTKDQQAGAGWLLRAAELGSAQSAFNVGVMYERGFVVERDSAKAAQWYRKAADGGVPMAKHNLALLLRDGKGVPRDGKAAIELLQQSARQGMAASMFSLGDIYERGDAAPRDPTAALAWFAITGEFERQANRGEEPLARSASQRASVLQRTLTPEELKQAQEIAQTEFKRIVEALNPPKPPPPEPTPASPPSEAPTPPAAATTDTPPVWPASPAEQVRAIQQALFELGLLRDKPDGALGPMTRTAIRAFEKRSGARETGEASKDLYLSLRGALAHRDVVATSPLPTPPKEAPKAEPAKEPVKAEPVKPEPPRQEAAKAEQAKPVPAPAAPTAIELARAEPPPPPSNADFARPAQAVAAPRLATPKDPPQDPPKPQTPAIDTTKPQPVKVEIAPPSRIDLGSPELPPPPPTSTEFQRLAERSSPDGWPPTLAEQVRAVQRLLRELKLYGGPVDGALGFETRNAIREYERLAGIPPTGELNKTLFESLKEMRSLMNR